MKMRSTKTLYKQDSFFDLYQKTRRNSGNYRKNIDNNDNLNHIHEIERRRASKISQQANLYLTELVNDLKETIINNDDDIFSSNVTNKRKNSGIKAKLNKISKPKIKRFHINLSSKNVYYTPQSNRTKNGSLTNRIKKNNNLLLSNRSAKSNNSSKSNRTIKTHKSNNSNNLISSHRKLRERKKEKERSVSPLSNRSRISNKSTSKKNINYMKLDSKNRIKNPIAIKDKIKNQENNISLMGFRHTNTITFTKKSSLKPKDYKKPNFIPVINNSKFMRTSTTTKPVVKSVKFELPKKTFTLMQSSKKERSNKIVKKWSEVVNGTKKDREKGLFSLFQKPEHIDEGNNKSQYYSEKLFTNSFTDENEQIFNMTRISNKNILQINEITQDLKKSLILTPANGKRSSKNLKKTYILEEDELFDEIENNINSESENDDEKVDIEKYRDLQRKGLVYDSLDECDDEDISRLFIHPDSLVLFYLDVLVAICVFYDLIFIPLYLGNNDIYCRQGSFFTFSNLFEIVINIIYIFDFFIYFFVGYYDEDDHIKTNLTSMFCNYFKNWFLVNLMSAIPFKTIFTIYDKSCEDIGFLSSYKYSSQFYYLFVCMRLIKTSRLFTNKFFYFLNEKLDKFEFYNNYLGFFEGFAIFILTIHVVSCLFIFIGKNDYPNWIVTFKFTQRTFSQLYFLGIYYIITTVTTVGYGDLTCVTPNEKLFGIIIEIVGIMAYSWVLTSISNYVKSKSDKQEEYFKKYKILQDIKMTYNDFSDDLFERIDRYIKHKTNNEDEERQLIEELPITLKNSLVYSMYEPIIQNFVFFKNFDNKDFIVSVIFAFKPILAIKNDILIKDGEFVEDIIFVKKGKITLELPIKITQEVEEKGPTTQGNYNNNHKLFQFHNSQIHQMKNPATKFGFGLLNNLGNQETENEFCEEEEIVEYQKLKILDIRKNEHFGDVLMFSNERSPLCAVVKSRKAELFYLNKKDANEISVNYSLIWQKIQQKSIFNMKQIRRLMSRLQKIFYTTNGLTLEKGKKDELIGSNISGSIDGDLKSIPTISDFNNDEPHNNLKKLTKRYSNGNSSNSNNNNNHRDNEINNLKTIKEVTQIEDDYEDSYTSSQNDEEKRDLDEIHTKKYECGVESESSRFNESSLKIADTIKQPNIINKNVDFSEEYSSDDLKKNYILTSNSNITPFKPDEINNEIYPNENFMKYKESSEESKKTITKEVNNIIIHNSIINNNVNNSVIHNSIIKNTIINTNSNNNEIKQRNSNMNVIVNNNSFNNISFCSTEISFSINRKYDNIDELSDYKYSKTPKLRRKIKSILKDFDINELEFEYSKYKTNKLGKKTNSSYGAFLHQFKKHDMTKTASLDIMKKKKDGHTREKSYDNIRDFKTTKHSPVGLNFLDVITETNKKNHENQNPNDPPSFTQFLQNFIDNENVKNNNEFLEEKEELNLKMEKMKTVKRRSEMTVNHFYKNFG